MKPESLETRLVRPASLVQQEDAHLHIGESCFKYNNKRNENMFTDNLKLCLST